MCRPVMHKHVALKKLQCSVLFKKWTPFTNNVIVVYFYLQAGCFDEQYGKDQWGLNCESNCLHDKTRFLLNIDCVLWMHFCLLLPFISVSYLLYFRYYILWFHSWFSKFHFILSFFIQILSLYVYFPNGPFVKSVKLEKDNHRNLWISEHCVHVLSIY